MTPTIIMGGIVLWIAWWIFQPHIPIPRITVYAVWVKEDVNTEEEPKFLGIALTKWGARNIIQQDRDSKHQDFKVNLQKAEWMYEPVRAGV